MRIVAFTRYPYEGPSSRYRFYNYRNCFQAAGIAMEIMPFFSPSYFSCRGKSIRAAGVIGSYLRRLLQVLSLLMAPSRYDLVLIEYELFPYIPAFFEYLLYKRGIKYLADYDDAVFHKYDMHPNSLARSILGNKIGKVMRYARQVIVCNAYLESYASRYNGRTFRLPTVVLLDRYRAAILRHEDAPNNREKHFVIGWIGSKSTSTYILDILPAIEKFSNRYPVQFNFVGFDSSLLGEEVIERCRIHPIEWSEEREIETILAFDVGIMPLKDDAWSRGKCGFKLVQYMSCKKPVIASPVGINRELVREGENGFLARTAEEWYAAFETLYLDGQLRAAMAANNFEKIVVSYNHEKNCQRYTALLKRVAKS